MKLQECFDIYYAKSHNQICLNLLIQYTEKLASMVKEKLTIISAVTIFAIEIEITIFDQNRKKIESSISFSQSYDFQESKRCSFNDGCPQITLCIVNLASRHQFENIGPEVKRKASMT